MRLLSQSFVDRFYSFFLKFYNFEKVVKILPIDFEKPWWKIIWEQRLTWLIETISEILQQIYSSLTPVIFGYIFLSGEYIYLVYYYLGYLVLELFNRRVLWMHNLALTQTRDSIVFHAQKFFLSVDPIHHTTKSTGKIIGKIQGGAGHIEELLSLITSSLVPTITGYITVSILLWRVDWRLGLVTFCAFWIITLANGLISFLVSRAFKSKVSKMSDKTSAISVENLIQNQIIRSSFGTFEQLKKTQNQVIKDMSIKLTSKNTAGVGITVTRVLYITSVVVVGLVAINLINESSLTAQNALILMVTFVNGSSGVMRLGGIVRTVSDTYIRVNDLWEYIRNFGKQSYPVLPEDKIA